MPGRQVARISVVTSAATARSTASAWLPLNIYSVPFNVSFGVHSTGGGDVTFRVQHTFDELQGPNSTASPTPFTHADVTAATGNVDGNYAYPVNAVRVQIVSASATATLELIVLQAGL